MEDLNELALELRSSAERLSISILDADFLDEPSVVFDADRCKVDDILKLAQASSMAPYVVIEETHFSPEAHLQPDHLSRSPDAAPPNRLTELANSLDDELCLLTCTWVTSGLVHQYYAFSNQMLQFLAARNEWFESLEALDADQHFDDQARISYLTDQVELDPAYRAGNAQTRKQIGAQIIDKLIRPQDPAYVGHHALKRAREEVLANSHRAFDELRTRIAELAPDFERRYPNCPTIGRENAAVRMFLTENSGGYAPTDKVLIEFRDAFRAAICLRDDEAGEHS